MNHWTRACVAQTGSQNTFDQNGRKYFWELSRREHDDGAITGTIFELTMWNEARRVGSFRINGDGSVARAPRFLREAADEAASMMRDLVTFASGR
jgi:hypothetical protein